MTYEILARKWRPQTFDEVVGQDHITRTLKKAVEAGRLSHAYLLSGPRGCGKTSTARILAKVINCGALKEGNPCDACPSCTGVVRGNNLDVMEIDGASHTGVNEVRDLQESIGYAASQFANKVYIIDEVHMLSTHAFNALLKTLEEPPNHVYFVFATTAPHKIPDTIKSRCQRHQFKRLEVGEITGQLAGICKEEKVEFHDDALRMLARKAEGSMRDAESLLDQCITASSGKVDGDSVRDILGLLDQTMVVEFLQTMASRDATAVLEKLNGAVHQGVDLEELLNALIEGFRDLMVLAAPGDLAELVFRSQEEVATLRDLLTAYELGDLVTIVERMCNVAPRLKTASDPRIVLESTLVDITLLDRQTDIRALISRLEGSPGRGGGTSQPRRGVESPRGKKAAGGEGAARHLSAAETSAFPDKKTAGASSKPPVARQVAGPRAGPEPEPSPKDMELASLEYADIRKLWDGFVTYVRQKKLSLGVCLISGTIKSMDEHAVMLRFARGLTYQKAQVEQAASKKFLKGMMKKYFGRDLELFCFSEGEEAQAERDKMQSKKDAGMDESARRPIESRPLVRKILSDFDGEIVRYHPQ
jgi:DNA polymerase-3 subunit gamma/tau